MCRGRKSRRESHTWWCILLLTHLFYPCCPSVFVCFIYFNMTLSFLPFRLIRCKVFGVWLYSPAPCWHCENPDNDINKEGLHLIPSCQIPSKYFPVVLLYTSPHWALLGISVTRHNNVSATSLFSHFMLSSLVPRAECTWRRTLITTKQIELIPSRQRKEL